MYYVFSLFAELFVIYRHWYLRKVAMSFSSGGSCC